MLALMNLRSQQSRLLACACFLVLAVVLLLGNSQSKSYHNLADKRTLLSGIPNTVNVLSSFPFLVTGTVGIVLVLHSHQYFTCGAPSEAWAQLAFFGAILGAAFGSAYYHLRPNDSRLAWNRLPTTCAFASALALFIHERAGERRGAIALVLLLALGGGSVFYWRATGDLRPYLLVEYLPVIGIPVATAVYPPKHSHTCLWLLAAAWYIVAKLCETYDRKIFRLLAYTVSGHSLKHVLAAAVPICILLMLSQRQPVSERRSFVEAWLLKES